jgi:hypothetical protein
MRSTIGIAGVETFASSGGNRFTTFKLQPFAGAAYSVENNPTLMGSEGDERFFQKGSQDRGSKPGARSRDATTSCFEEHCGFLKREVDCRSF